MKSCDNEARRVTKTIRSKIEESNMVKFGKFCVITNDGVVDRPVIETVRIIDAIESENNCLLDKCPEHCHLIEKEARNVRIDSCGTKILARILHARNKVLRH